MENKNPRLSLLQKTQRLIKFGLLAVVIGSVIGYFAGHKISEKMGYLEVPTFGFNKNSDQSENDNPCPNNDIMCLTKIVADEINKHYDIDGNVKHDGLLLYILINQIHQKFLNEHNYTVELIDLRLITKNISKWQADIEDLRPHDMKKENIISLLKTSHQQPIQNTNKSNQPEVQNEKWGYKIAQLAMAIRYYFFGDQNENKSEIIQQEIDILTDHLNKNNFQKALTSINSTSKSIVYEHKIIDYLEHQIKIQNTLKSMIQEIRAALLKSHMQNKTEAIKINSTTKTTHR